MKENKIELFSTPVWGFVLNDQKYQSRDYLDLITSLEQTQPSEKKSNIGGYQTHDNLHHTPVVKEFVETIQNIGARCFEDYNQKPCKAQVTEMWGNVNYGGCYNAAHIHGEALSGVFYLQTPANSGRLILCNPAVRSDGRAIRHPNYSIIPEPLGCIIFPSWLEHYVEPNLSKENRISISFNLKIIL